MWQIISLIIFFKKSMLLEYGFMAKRMFIIDNPQLR